MDDLSRTVATTADKTSLFDFVCLILMTTVCFMGLYGPQPLLAGMAQSLDISQSAASLLMTAAVAPMISGPFIYGAVLRFMGLRSLLRLLAPLCAASLIVPGLYPSYPLFTVCRLVQGLCISGILMCITASIASHYTGRELQIRMTLYAAATAVGAFFGGMLCGFLGEHIGWPRALVCLGVLQAVFAVPLTLMRESAVPGTAAPFGLRATASFFTETRLRIIVSVTALCVFCHASFFTVLPFYLHDLDSNIGDISVGIIYFCGIVGPAVGLFPRVLLRLFGSVHNIVGAGICLLIFSVPMILIQTVTAATAAVLTECIGFMLVYTTMPGILNRCSPFSKSMTNSVYIACYYLFSSAGTFLPVTLYVHQGISTYGCLIFVIFTAAALLAFTARKLVRLD